MLPHDTTTCPECGAPVREGKSCREQYEALLVLEYENPAIFGAVHHLTVPCYNIQHPSGFTEPALAWMRSSLRAIIGEGMSPAEMRRRAREQFEGPAKVRRDPQPGERPTRTHWSMTVADIRTDSPEVYQQDIMAWARSILRDLGDAKA